MHPTNRSTQAGALLLTASLALVACGKSDKTTNTASGSGGTTTTAAASSGSSTTAASSGTATATAVKVKKDAKLGPILADSRGMTLYTLTANGKAVACTGTCLSVWPPATPPSDAMLGTVAGEKITEVSGPGGKILAADGLPLYTFARDGDAGDAYGDGVTSFGGTWHVVKAMAASGGAPTSSDMTTTTSGSSSSSSNGY